MKETDAGRPHDRAPDSGAELAAGANALGIIPEHSALRPSNVQRGAQRTARDSATVAPSAIPLRQSRDPRTGRFLKLPPGAVGAATTNALHTGEDRGNSLPAPYEFLRRELDHYLGACESDEGGSLAEVPARRRSQLEYRARLHRRILQLDSALELRGIVDPRTGKLRSAWLSTLQSLMTTALSIDRLLGLARVAKPVPSLQDWLNAAGAEDEQSVNVEDDNDH